MNKIIDIAPLIIFVALILVLLTFLSEKEDQLESVLIDSTFPCLLYTSDAADE